MSDELKNYIIGRLNDLEEYVEKGYADKEDLREIYVLEKILKYFDKE